MPCQDLEVKALEKVSNKYALTVLVCKRVKQLQRGAKPLIAEDTLDHLDIALKEIATGKIAPVTPPAEPTPDTPEEVETSPEVVAQTSQPDSIESPDSVESNDPPGAAAGA